MSAFGGNLTEAEWQVMECLWTKAPRTGREVVDCMKEAVGWSRSTTLTLLQRLETKGAVRSDSTRGKKTFAPAVQREDVAVRETEDFLHRVFQGSVSLLVSSLTKKQALPKEEIDELYTILRDMEEGKPHD